MKADSIFLAFAALMVGFSSAHADAYRCSQPDGKIVYQGTPCASGAQKTVDDSRAKARERAEAEKKQESESVAKVAKQLRRCMAEGECESFYYVRLLSGKPMSVVTDALGDPQSVQNIGGQEIQYFSVPVADGRKRAKLQVTYSYGKVDKVNVY